VIAGPLGPEEAILHADLDLELGVRMKLRHDFAGHYNRPDVFQLQISTANPHLLAVHDTDGRQPARPIEEPRRPRALEQRPWLELTEGRDEA
jgi:aliphatic nitrilase